MRRSGAALAFVETHKRATKGPWLEVKGDQGNVAGWIIGAFLRKAQVFYQASIPGFPWPQATLLDPIDPSFHGLLGLKRPPCPPLADSRKVFPVQPAFPASDKCFLFFRPLLVLLTHFLS